MGALLGLQPFMDSIFQLLLFCKLFFFFFFFLGPHLWHMEVPKLGVELELRLPVYITANSNLGSELRLRPTPQLMGTLDPQSTERGQG